MTELTVTAVQSQKDRGAVDGSAIPARKAGGWAPVGAVAAHAILSPPADLG